jgi:small subunit ribosomal protein S2
MEQNGIHIIDLKKTESKLEDAKAAARNIAKSGRRVLFVATKKQAKEIVAQEAQRAGMPFVTERWLGGMLTNFQTVRRSIKRMQIIDRMNTDGTFERLNKKERLMLNREKIKLARVLGGIEEMTKLPGALFVVDIKREHLAVSEADRLGIPVFGVVDTNADPTSIMYPIPGNDDASKSIYLMVSEIADAIMEGSIARKKEKAAEESKQEETAQVAQAETE